MKITFDKFIVFKVPLSHMLYVMTQLCPDGTQTYGQDNRSVWQILHNTLKDHHSYTSIRRFARSQNNRAAYFALKQNHFGPNRQKNPLKWQRVILYPPSIAKNRQISPLTNICLFIETFSTEWSVLTITQKLTIPLESADFWAKCPPPILKLLLQLQLSKPTLI